LVGRAVPDIWQDINSMDSLAGYQDTIGLFGILKTQIQHIQIEINITIE